MDWKFKVWDKEGELLASGSAPTEAKAYREALHYAAVYAGDGYSTAIIRLNPKGCKIRSFVIVLGVPGTPG